MCAVCIEYRFYVWKSGYSVIFSHVQSYHHAADQDTGVLPPKLLGILSIALSAHLFSPSLNPDRHCCSLWVLNFFFKNDINGSTCLSTREDEAGKLS